VLFSILLVFKTLWFWKYWRFKRILIYEIGSCRCKMWPWLQGVLVCRACTPNYRHWYWSIRSRGN